MKRNLWQDLGKVDIGEAMSPERSTWQGDGVFLRMLLGIMHHLAPTPAHDV